MNDEEIRRAKEKEYERGRREGARRMAMELARIFGPPYDRVNGDPKYIMAKETDAEICTAYAEMDDPLQWLDDTRVESELA